jgi:hypothetical protein
VAEGARLESVFTRKGNVGSNPTLSAILPTCINTVLYHHPLDIRATVSGVRFGRASCPSRNRSTPTKI